MPKLLFDPEGLHSEVLNVVSNAMNASDPRHRPEPDPFEGADPDAPAAGADAGSRQGSHRVRPRRIAGPRDCRGQRRRHCAEDQEHVFSLFVSNKGNRGTGLGLPVSQKIIREHGGQILVGGTPGQGTEFTLEIPAVLADVTRNLDENRG